MNLKQALRTAAAFAMLVLAIAVSLSAKAANDSNVVADKWIAAWNSHDPAKMLPVFTDDVFYEDVAYGEISHGRAELRKFAADEFEAVPDLQLKLLRASISNGHGTIEWSFSGTDKGIYKTGKKFTVRGVSIIDVRDSKIARSLDFYDSGTIMRQVGVLPAQ
ncbi:MAG: nuclear transport factor 2 family protein [Terriglobales bacterium]